MNEPSAWILVALAALSGFGAALFQSPVRAAASFLLALLFSASLLLARAQPAVAGLVLWVAGGGAGLLVLGTLLLLNLSPEEAGVRRFRLAPVLALFLLAWFGAALVGIVAGEGVTASRGGVLEPAQGSVAQGSVALDSVALDSAALDSAALGRSLYGEHGLALAVAFLGLCAVVIASLVMARRRA